MRKEYFRQEERQCKGPEVDVYPAWSKKSEEMNVSGVELGVAGVRATMWRESAFFTIMRGLGKWKVSSMACVLKRFFCIEPDCRGKSGSREGSNAGMPSG